MTIVVAPMGFLILNTGNLLKVQVVSGMKVDEDAYGLFSYVPTIFQSSSLDRPAQPNISHFLLGSFVNYFYGPLSCTSTNNSTIEQQNYFYGPLSCTRHHPGRNEILLDIGDPHNTVRLHLI